MDPDSIVTGKGVRWLGKMRKEVANDIRGFVKLCSESEGAGGSLSGWREPKVTIFQRYTLEGSIDKYGEVYSMLHTRNKRNWILEKWDRKKEEGDFIAQQCRVGRREIIEAIKNLRRGYCTSWGYKYQLELICWQFRTEARIKHFDSHPTKLARSCAQCIVFRPCPFWPISAHICYPYNGYSHKYKYLLRTTNIFTYK